MAGFLVASYLLLTYALPLVLPFAVALLLAEVIDPLVSALTFRGRVPRSLAATVVVLIFVGLVVTGLTAAIARLVHEIQNLLTQLPHLYAVGTDLSARFAEQFGAFRESLPASIQDVLNRNLTALQNSLAGSLSSVASLLLSFTGVPAFITNLVIAFIATFFISRDRQIIGRFLLSLFPEEWRGKLREVKTEVWSGAIGFAKAQALLILLTMVQSIIGLGIIGANYALLMGVIVGVADLMPILGPAAIFVPWIAYNFLFGSQVFGVKLLIVYLLVAAVRQVLEAKFVGEQVGLHPLAILLSIYLGFQFFGALGFVFGPLLAILLKTMLKSGLLPWH